MEIVFVDRDDTLIRCLDLPEDAWAGGQRGDTADPAWVEPLDGAIQACQTLRDAGYWIVVITNQGMVARGNAPVSAVADVHARMRAVFVDRQGEPLIHACYACPFHFKGNVRHMTIEHPWRKPAGGMLRAAAHELGLPIAGAWMIGDAARDLEAGIDAGLRPERCLRVGEGHPTLTEHVELILSHRTETGTEELNTPSGSPSDSMSAAPDAGESIHAAATGVLRARAGEPLTDESVRDTVLAAAHAIAERTGIRVLHLDADASGVRAVLETNRLAAMGFMAELRRTTNAWYSARHNGEPLWQSG
jgi:histidinol-phosphate phosphatase family protein